MRRFVLVPLAALLAVSCTSGSESTSSAKSTGTPSAPSSSAASSSAASSAALSSTSGAPAGKDGKPRLETAAEDLDSPLYLTAPKGDSRLYVVERGGVVRIIDGGKALPQPFLDISKDVKAGGEQGLLSIAFSPSYATDGHVYVDYTDGDGNTRVAEFTRGGQDSVDPASRRELLKVDQPFANHNGGLLLFDPSGMLLVGLGDGGSGGDPDNRGQDLGDLLGKILRLDPRADGDKPYRIPPDNPFVGKAGVRPEIWAYGVRNPWRFSFGPDGSIFVADVGQNAAEEIDVVPAGKASGANYGWSIFEADRRFKKGKPTPGGILIEPSLVYEHKSGRCSVTGGGVYAGSVTGLRGRYLYADFCSGEVWAAAVDGTKLTDPQKLFTTKSPASFGVDAAGEMYVVSIEGSVKRITA